VIEGITLPQDILKENSEANIWIKERGLKKNAKETG
jgi:hypothetical protein